MTTKHQYVVYTRDETGRIARMPPDSQQIVTLSDAEAADKYPETEILRGWPERQVCWTRAYGPAAGIARRTA